MNNPALGLTLIFVWMAIIVIVPILLHKKVGVPTFYTRKMLHIGTAFVWIIGRLCMGNTWHMFIPNTLSFLAIAASYFMKPMEGIEEEAKEGERRNYGTLYFAISTMLITACNFSDTLYPYAGLSFCALAFGDGFAAICGKLAKKHNPKLCGNKSLVGLLTCFCVTFAVAVIFNFWLRLELSWLGMLAIAGTTALLELYTPFGLDNITIPLIVTAMGVGLGFGVIPDAVLLVCVISPLFAIITLSKKVFTPVAAASAFVFLIAFAWISDYTWVINIFIGYGFILVAKVVRHIVVKKRGESEETSSENKHSRGFKQLISNLGIPLVLMNVYYFTGFTPFAVGAYASFACTIGDSMASDIGVLQKAKPFDICHWKRVDTGMSGGVSVLGSSIAVFVAGINVLVCIFIAKMLLFPALIVGGMSIMGVMLDSVLGSLTQAKYRCPTCGKLVESNVCCGTKTELVSGYRIIDNNMVNIISNSVAAAMGILIALLAL